MTNKHGPTASALRLGQSEPLSRCVLSLAPCARRTHRQKHVDATKAPCSRSRRLVPDIQTRWRQPTKRRHGHTVIAATSRGKNPSPPATVGLQADPELAATNLPHKRDRPLGRVLAGDLPRHNRGRQHLRAPLLDNQDRHLFGGARVHVELRDCRHFLLSPMRGFLALAADAMAAPRPQWKWCLSCSRR